MPDTPETTGYPAAERLDILEELHGRPVADPYRWLEDPDDPRTVAWSSAQDRLFAEHRVSWPGIDQLRTRIRELLSVGSVGTPVWRGERVFFVRRTAEQEHAVLLTVDPDGQERTLVDPTAIDPAGTTTLDFWCPSHEGDLLAYGLSHGGTEQAELRILDVATGAVVDGPIDRTPYTDIGWLPGGQSFYYVRYLAPDQVTDDNPRLYRRVHLHRIGADADTDPVITGADAPRGTYFGLQVTPDGHWLTVTASLGTDPRDDVWLADLTSSPPEAPDLRVLQQSVDAWTSPYVRDGMLYLSTDRDAPRGRICVTTPGELAYPSWRELVAEDPDAVLADLTILDGPELDRPVLVLLYHRHVVSEVSVHDLATGTRLHTVTLPGVGTVGAVSGRPSGGYEAWLSYGDFTTPSTVYRFDATSRELSVWARPPGAVHVPDLVSRQVSYPSRDGTTVRMFVVGAADAPPGPRPTLLYGYGGFNIAQSPGYSAMAIAWVEAGGVYAVANLRGGSEEGEEWHRDGMLQHKQNVFDDFHAAADWLTGNGVTTPDRLAIFGGSNGGLLVGAALTQHPEKYAAVVCSAPLLDMIRYELFGLGSTWAGEYGSASDPEQFGWLLAYSPYHNVRPGTEYPAVLFTVFDGDSRVDTLHARKLAAALQHATSTGPQLGPVLLRRETDVGHSTRAVSRTVDLVADEVAFLAAHTGLKLPAS